MSLTNDKILTTKNIELKKEDIESIVLERLHTDIWYMTLNCKNKLSIEDTYGELEALNERVKKYLGTESASNIDFKADGNVATLTYRR